MVTRLDEIIAAHRHRLQGDDRDLNALIGDALLAPARRDFEAALRAPGLSVIAEIKRRSPSAGPLAEDLDPAELANRYQAAGAAAISVLTDEKYFGGAPTDLRAAHEVTSIPVLRKDFVIDEKDLADTRTMGADAALLIVAALTDEELRQFAATGSELGLHLLFEAHDETEVARAVSCGAKIIGINQRDLHTFQIDPHLAVTLRHHIPDGVVAVAESGISVPADAQRMFDAGFDAVLVGTALVTSGDLEQVLGAMAECS